MLRPIITSRVADEVPTRMHRLVKARLSEGQRLWVERYLPHTTIVDCESGPLDPSIEALVAPVRERDPDDAPTAYLAIAVAPCVVLTADKDLLDYGFGAPEWLDGVRASGQVVDLDGGAFISMRIAEVLIGSVAFPGAARVGKWVGSEPLLAGAAAGVLYLAWDAGYLRIPALQERLRRAANVMGRGLADVIEMRRVLIETLAPYVLPPLADPPLVARLASTLALTRGALQPESFARSAEDDLESVRAALAGSSMFVSAPGGWTLGSAAT